MHRRKFIQNTSLATLGATFLPLSCNAHLDTEFLILGGGISGLSLAYHLQKAGRECMVLEGSNRLGGRLFFHPEIGRDVGGRGLGDKYEEVMKLVKELEVELIDVTHSFRSPTAVYFNGKLHVKWDANTPNPSRLEFSKLKNAPKLESLEEWYQRPDLDKKYSDYLQEIGHSSAEIDLINLNANYNDVYEASAINSLHSRAFRQFNGTKRIFNFKGGSKNFIQALTSKINAPLRTEKMVVAIEDKGKSVTVKCTDGSIVNAKKVISTLPFSTLREVDIRISLNDNQRKAIQELPYTAITQIHLQATEPFWEADEMPVGMWTDTALERLMLINPDVEKGELVCWVNGKGTARFDAISDQEIAQFTLQKLKGIRPATEGKIEYVGTHKWGKYPFNKGAYAEFGVGHAALFKDMIQPAGNLHFAGEHTAMKSRGIEGAAESAVRVLRELI